MAVTDFFPNSDTNKVRKRRIEKAKEFGATWIKDWTSSVTHVIMDDKMNYQELTKYLKLEALPVRGLLASNDSQLTSELQSEVMVVNETYPSDCISYRRLEDPKARYYQVPGMPKPAEILNAVPVDLSSSDSSLPLKPAAGAARELDTPTASTESCQRASEQAVSPNQTAEDASVIPVTRATGVQVESTSFGYNDDLSAIIKDAQNLKNIVSDSSQLGTTT
jgi:DNA polymerase IV